MLSAIALSSLCLTLSPFSIRGLTFVKMVSSIPETGASPFKFRVCVPGVGTAGAHTITTLRLDGVGFAETVERVLGGNSTSKCIWLDILTPSASDILNLAQVVGMDSDAVRGLLGSALVDRLHGTIGALPKPLPACRTTDSALYLCWAETMDTADKIEQFLTSGRMAPTDTADGLEPVPQWMAPVADRDPSGHTIGLRTGVRQGRRSEPESTDIELENRIKRLYRVLDSPKPNGTARVHATVRRWGTRGRHWDNSLRHSEKACSGARTLAGEISQYRAGPALGHHTVQVWTQGPIVITFHQHLSLAIDSVFCDMARREFRSASAECIVQSLVSYWLHTSSECLPLLTRVANALDHDLTKPGSQQACECAQWIPILVRSRKIVLELMRRSQTNASVLAKLGRWLGMDGSIHTLKPVACYQLQSATPLVKHFSRLLSMDRDVDRQVKTTNLSSVCGHPLRRRYRVCRLQCHYAKVIWQAFKETEVRFARLHRMLLDRQRRRLLTAEHTIHCRLRSLSFAQLLFWPLDTAHSLLRLNGIKTIGRLSSDRGNPREFWYVLLVFFAYLVIATATHRYRLRRAEAKAAASKEAKRQMADRCRRAKPWLAAPRQTQRQILRATAPK